MTFSTTTPSLPSLPGELSAIRTLALDLRWAWDAAIEAVFEWLDPALWAEERRNPIRFLRRVSPDRLAAAASDQGYLRHLGSVCERLASEDRRPPAEPAAREMRERGETVAYFSAEFGIAECLPLYAGGLGVLAADHLKSASDLSIPMVAVGLFYKEGYFRQVRSADGGQQEEYAASDASNLPLGIAESPFGGSSVIEVPVGDRSAAALIRVARVGRVPLLLLDSDVSENDDDLRHITRRLYGGDLEMRLRQEILLGIGGLRALDRIGLPATLRHLNEGHAAFATIERIRQIIASTGLSFAEARELAAAGNIFTTHTPVPAGIDLFPRDLIQRHFEGYVRDLNIGFEEFFDLGRDVAGGHPDYFSMAVLALRLSSRSNAVSKLHARVSRRLWRWVTPQLPEENVPIGSITNGVHVATWTARSLAEIGFPLAAAAADPKEVWERHSALRSRLADVCRAKDPGASLFDGRALTIGFARRFATYKRATLILSDRDRLARLLANPDRPVQLVFAGKSHPRDEAGKALLNEVATLSADPRFAGRTAFLEDYDLAVARLLVTGCDVWLNTPERPHEASGTSGMKAALNGVLNLSVLDGWWDEAPRDETGFSIGPPEDHCPAEKIAEDLYSVLESQVVPLYYDRSPDGLPDRWIARMQAAASQLGSRFSSERMVREYLDRAYLPSARRGAFLRGEKHDRLSRLVAWKERVARTWPSVRIASVEYSVSDGTLLARLHVPDLHALDISVAWRELGAPAAAALEAAGRIGPEMIFRAPLASGSRAGALTIRPTHPDLLTTDETGLLLRWEGAPVSRESAETRSAEQP